MKALYVVLPSIRRFSKRHSVAWLRGYIYSLMDWEVISQDTFNKLIKSIEKYYHSIPARSYDNSGDLI